MEEMYLEAALKKDAKLQKFIMKTLNDGPTSDSDDSNESTHDFPPRTGIELVSADHTFLSDPINTSFSELKDADQTELTFYFAEPNDVERECVAAHVKRLKRELDESNKRKADEPTRKEFTGKVVQVGRATQDEKKLKRLPRPRHKLQSQKKKSTN